MTSTPVETTYSVRTQAESRQCLAGPYSSVSRRCETSLLKLGPVVSPEGGGAFLFGEGVSD